MRRESVETANWIGYEVLHVREPFELSQNCVWHQAMENEPWDFMAWKHWRNEGWWYLIGDVNGVNDPFIFPKSGQRIAIPRIY